MSKHKFFWIDAFSEKRFGGNPCAVVFTADSLTEDQMLSITREMNLSETAFVLKSAKADFAARYFTPAEEIPMAGHPTIATVHALLQEGELKNKKRISLELKAGMIEVELDAETRMITMSQKKPEFLSLHNPSVVADLFGITPQDFVKDSPIQTVSTGTPQLMMLVKNHQVLKKAQVFVDKYRTYKSQSDFFSPHMFCLEAVSSEGTTFARHFGIPPDTAEDPFTGSSTGGMAAYLWHYGYISKPTFIAEQGHWMGRPGKAWVEVIGQPDNIQTVKVGGQAVQVIRGEIEI